MIKGVAASSGIGIGKALLIRTENLQYTPKQVSDTAAECKRFRTAVETFCNQTQQQAEQVRKNAGEKEAEILSGHILMIQDPYMSSEIESRIEQGSCAEQALDEVCQFFIDAFGAADDELTNQRAADVKDIRDGILRILLGITGCDISSAPAGTVLVGDELTPSAASGIDKTKVVGIVMRQGGKTSHSAILARALGIPAVLSAEGILDACTDGDELIVDADRGEVIVRPTEDVLQQYQQKRDLFLKQREELNVYRGKSSQTKDGVEKEVFCNIGTVEEIESVTENDGEGIGLFRTEFLFLSQSKAPTEEEQFEVYKKVALSMKGRPVIIRTLDVGGDKEIPYMGLKKEENPFLGFRAIRYCLHHEDFFKSQLRALLRASAFGEIQIMLPLVTTVSEIRHAKALIKKIMEELDIQQIPYNKQIKIGTMIETASAAILADVLAHECDFFSIGTNDLVQYTMSVDRGNTDVAYLYSPYQPSVLRLLKYVIEKAVQAGISVGMCGEAASDPLMMPLLIAFGLQEFSVTPSAALQTRRNLSLWTVDEAKAVAEKALQLEDEKQIRELLQKVAK